YSVSIQLIRLVRPLVERIAKHDRDLADQIRRAMNSIPLNLSEGRKSRGGNQTRLYSYACGSNDEVRAGLESALAWEWIEEAEEALALVDRLAAMTWRLTHPRRSAA
ncbi:MAG: four helix bundle protein, partial [Kofleriaceae bacterium]